MSLVCACIVFISSLLRHRLSFVDIWIPPLIDLDVDSTSQSVRASLLLIVRQDWCIASFFVCRLCLRIYFVLLCDLLLTFVYIRRAIFYKLPSDEFRGPTPPLFDWKSRARPPRDITSKGYAMLKAAARAVVISSENTSSSLSHFTPYCCVVRSGADAFDWQKKILWLFLQQGASFDLEDLVWFERHWMMRINLDELDIDSSRIYDVLFFAFSFQDLWWTKLRHFVIATIRWYLANNFCNDNLARWRSRLVSSFVVFESRLSLRIAVRLKGVGLRCQQETICLFEIIKNWRDLVFLVLWLKNCEDVEIDAMTFSHAFYLYITYSGSGAWSFVA